MSGPGMRHEVRRTSEVRRTWPEEGATSSECIVEHLVPRPHPRTSYLVGWGFLALASGLGVAFISLPLLALLLHVPLTSLAHYWASRWYRMPCASAP